MIINGKFYTGLTVGSDQNGEITYSSELKECIEETGELCLKSLKDDEFRPIMMIGNIQSGKTRAFLGLMALCFDNEFDMTIILTKSSKALVKQTVSRMTDKFNQFHTGNATIGDVVAQDILDMDFTNAKIMEDKEKRASVFLQKYKGKKRIIIVKKEAYNVDRINLFIEELVRLDYYRRILIIDDEADITSIGYEKYKDQTEISLRRISGAINTMRKRMHRKTEHVMVQVTATPYALYLQPETFSDEYIMPIKPFKTIIVPTGEGYIGGQYYFIDSDDENSESFYKARHLPQIVSQEEMSILNGSRKNSGKNAVIKDGRTVRLQDFIKNQKDKPTFVCPSLRMWIFDLLVGAAIIQLNPDNEGFYVSGVMHAATPKKIHNEERNILDEAVAQIKNALEKDIDDEDVMYFIKTSYDRMKDSVNAYGVLELPPLDAVKDKIAANADGRGLEGLIAEVDIKEVNSDNDIAALLNNSNGELRLENSITIFIGGQVLDRGITIPNMINFFYGRDPGQMQQDTVLQHCRMFGYRTEVLLSVTRLFTTSKLFSRMQEITIRDNILRKRMRSNDTSSVIYLEAGDKIRACSPQKVLASKIENILPEKRYLPVGFEIEKQGGLKCHREILKHLTEMHAILDEKHSNYKKGETPDNYYIRINSAEAIELLKKAYEPLIPKEDGTCNRLENIEPVFWFSLSEKLIDNDNGIALITRRERNLRSMKRDGTYYQNAPDDGSDEGALAKELRKDMPVLLLIEQIHPDWKTPFWWPVYYTPADMNVGIYAEEEPKTGVAENWKSMASHPIQISRFEIINRINLDEEVIGNYNAMVGRIKDFYDKEFQMDGIFDSSITRKEIPCMVFIDDESPAPEDILKELKKIKEKAVTVLETIGEELNQNDKNSVLAYFDMLKNMNVDDEVRENVLELIANATGLVKEKKDKLVGLIKDSEDRIKENFEWFGVFMPIIIGKCEIHIYHSAVKDACEKIGISKDSDILEFCEITLAHEIYHALHYTEVMTESGRWLYTNKDYAKQGATQESLAEYFCRCYAKTIAETPGDLEFNDRLYALDLKDFPKDGGYSGAIIIEKNDSEDLIGHQNEFYKTVFLDSLRDMPKSFIALEEKRAGK